MGPSMTRTQAGYGPPSNRGSSATDAGADSIESMTSRPAAEVRKILTLPCTMRKMPAHSSPSQKSISSAAKRLSTARWASPWSSLSLRSAKSKAIAERAASLGGKHPSYLRNEGGVTAKGLSNPSNQKYWTRFTTFLVCKAIRQLVTNSRAVYTLFLKIVVFLAEGKFVCIHQLNSFASLLAFAGRQHRGNCHYQNRKKGCNSPKRRRY